MWLQSPRIHRLKKGRRHSSGIVRTCEHSRPWILESMQFSPMIIPSPTRIRMSRGRYSSAYLSRPTHWRVPSGLQDHTGRRRPWQRLEMLGLCRYAWHGGPDDRPAATVPASGSNSIQFDEQIRGRCKFENGICKNSRLGKLTPLIMCSVTSSPSSGASES